MAFKLPDDRPLRYLTLTKMKDRKMTLVGGEESREVLLDRGALEKYWTGVAFIPWRNFLNYDGEIPTYAPEDAVITLKMILRDIGFDNVQISPAYDASTREAIETLQQKHGLPRDGVVGSLTKIVLYNENPAFQTPQIVEE
jgi:general secretion pathway protein A